MVEKLKSIWMNGKLVDWDDAKVHVLTHAFHYGTGAFEVLESLVDALPGADEGDLPTPDDEAVRIAIVGRPNVGKSSLLNRLLGEERVVVSEVAGTTRDAIDTRFDYGDRRFVLVDTAGLRRPGRRSGTGERVGALMTVRSLERAEVALLLVDAAEGWGGGEAVPSEVEAIAERVCRDL